MPERSSEFVAVYRQGLDLLERHKLRAAERAFVRCVALEPTAYEGHWQLGRLRLLQGRIDEGVNSLQEALARAPELAAARALVLETFLGRGREALEEGRYEQATGYFARALAVDPDGYEPLYEASITALWQRDYARADSLLKRAIERYPEVLELRWHLDQIWRQMGRPVAEMPETYRFPQKQILATASSGRFREMARELGIDKKDGGRSSAWATSTAMAI